MNQRCIFLLTTILFIELTVNAQNQSRQQLVAASGEITNSNYLLSWSIGELFTNSFASSNYQAIEGFNETTGIYLITGVGDFNTLRYSLYPNPFSNTIILETPSDDPNNLDISFLDELGKAIQFDIIKEKNKMVITPREIASGLYFFLIRTDQGEIQRFKIIKK